MTRVHVPDEVQQQILSLYESGLCLQAYAIARPYAPLTEWEGTDARLLAGRLIANLGGERTAHALFLRTWRADPTHPQATVDGIRALMMVRGPLPAWEAVRRTGDLADASDSTRAEWLAIQAGILGTFRDFESADALVGRALDLTPEDAWIHTVKAWLLQQEDQLEGCLAVARHALEIRPWFRPAVMATASGLLGLNRVEEALALLTEADEHVESDDVAGARAVLLIELERFAEAELALDRYEVLSPLADRHRRQLLAGLRADLASQRGDLAAASRFCRVADTKFHRAIADRLDAASPTARRLCLPVPFVRQHHDTCAPATLSAIARFWGQEVEHVEVADAICYAGTPSHRPRQWAEEHGWAARQFTLTWESAIALLDRGVPFTLGLVMPGAGHLVAVVGYDERRGTFLVRDPSLVVRTEALAPELLDSSRASGPLAMAMVPADRADLLDGLDLPDATLYDGLYAVRRALDCHDRAAAAAAYEAMSGEHPGHRLTIEAALALDYYDDDAVKTLQHLEELLALFPEDANIRLARLSCLERLARRGERLDLLRAYSDEKDAPPIILHQYAEELSRDAREAPEALRLLRRALRRDQLSVGCINAMGGLLWDRQEREQALSLYRFAACVGDKNETLVRAYFVAARHLRQTEAAIDFLRDRYQRFGGKSAWPAQSLFWALEQLDRVPEGFELLEEAERRRPADSDHLLFAADARARYGQSAEAERLLAAARPVASAAAWLRLAAALATYRADRAEALARWRDVVAGEPLALDAHRAIALLTAETEGRDAALQYLRAACERFPFHEPLHELWISWLRGQDDLAAEQALRHLLDVNPVNGWARRELALTLIDLRRGDEALAEADAAVASDPTAPASHGIRGAVLRELGRIGEAEEAYRASIHLSVDYASGVEALVALSTTPAERREALGFIQEELVRQVIFADALFAFRSAASQVLSPDEVLGRLWEAHAARPDLWQAWSALLGQLSDMGYLDEAHARAVEAVERFPLVARLWLDLSQVERLRGDGQAQREAIEKALAINPLWSAARRALADAYEQKGSFEESREVMERAVAQAPLDAENHGYLAYALWRLGEREAALERLQRALELEPGYDWAWAKLGEWSRELGQPDLAAATARALTERRAGDARSWLTLAQTLDKPADLEERLSALDRASSLAPRASEIYDLRARLLAGASRYEEAKAACRPAVFGDAPPPELLGRAAWVEAASGKVDEAKRQMEAVVRDNPEYYWGWCRLEEWSESTADKESAIRAATRLTQIAANRAVSWGYLASAFESSGDKDVARSHLRHAVSLDPSYSYAAFQLFDLAVAADDLAEAAEALRHLKAHVGGAEVTARAVVLAARRSEVSDALRELKELCLSAEKDPAPFDLAFDALRAAKAERQARRALREAAKDPRANPHVKRLLAEPGLRKRLGDWQGVRNPGNAALLGAVGIVGGLLVILGGRSWGRYTGGAALAFGAAWLLRALATRLRERHFGAATVLYWLPAVVFVLVMLVWLLGLLR